MCGNNLSRAQGNAKNAMVSQMLGAGFNIVFDYISETFFTKTYIENSIMLQEFIVTLNTINNIIGELQIEFEGENKKKKK